MFLQHPRGATDISPSARMLRRYAGGMNKNSAWTIVGVVVAVIIAWILVSVLFNVLWFVAKLAVVAVVAVVMFLVLRGVFSKSE